MNISNYLEDALIKHTLGLGVYSSPASTWVALLQTMSNDGTVYTELSGSNYVRRQILPTHFDAPTDGTTANNVDITWPAALADWGSVRYVAIFDSAVAGNMLWWGELEVVKYISRSAIFTIREGDLAVGAAGAFSQYSRNGVINLSLRNNNPTFASPSEVYVGIGVVPDVYNSSLSEPGAGYSRVRVTSFGAVANGVYTILTPAISFIAGANWGEITHIGLFDAATAGNLYYALEMDPSRNIHNGDGLTFETYTITIRIQ